MEGTYLSNEEYYKYSQIYPNIKKSDWDIRTQFKTNVKEYGGHKLDIQFGEKGVKV